MISSPLSSNNYGTINATAAVNKVNKTQYSVWKGLMILFGLFFVICVGIYYYGGFNSFIDTTASGSNKVSSSMNKNLIEDAINEDVMSHISAKYYESMARRNSNSKNYNSYGISSNAVNCDSLREQLNEETQEQTNEFVRYYSNELNDYLYTVYSDEVDNAGASYEADGSAGYLWSGELPGVTEPLYRYINEGCNGNDHFYSTQLANYGSSDWQQIAGFIMSQECSFNTALYEYYSESTCNHFYTINKNEIENGNSDFEYQRIVGYVAIE